MSIDILAKHTDKYWKKWAKPIINSNMKKETLKDFDPEIRDLVFDLNKHGQLTQNSCAGHIGEGYQAGAFQTTKGSIPLSGKGYVVIDTRSYNSAITMTILKKHKLKEIKLYFIGDRKLPAYTFKSLEKKR